MALRIQDQSPEVQHMAEHWPVAAALLGGTTEMRKAGRKFMLPHPAEEADAYAHRLQTATLFPAYRRTLNVLAGKPFAKEMTLGDDVPEVLKQWCQDVNLRGDSLHVFAGRLFREALAYGLCGIMVDMPVRPEGVANTQIAERLVGIRPYMTAVQHDDILGWRYTSNHGTLRLTQLRISESAMVDDGLYGSKRFNRVRLHEPGRWELWEEGENGEYTQIAEGATTLAEIPFVPVYGEQIGFMHGKSPLLDLAELNIKHWQSQSDQDNILRVARTPILAVSGLHDDDEFKMVIGSGVATRLPDGGDIQFIEHSGAAINAGQTSIDALEAQMIQTGAELLVRQPGQRTATEASNDAEANRSELLKAVESLEDSIDQALQFMADWAGLPEGGHVSLFKDYGASTLTDASAQLIMQMQQGGLITKATAIREQQRRGMLSPDIQPDEELEKVDAEGPALGRVSDDGE